MTRERVSEHAFFSASALLFAGSAALTTIWSGSMSAMGAMTMPGGWKMSMAWMRMPGESWPGSAASFIGMWIVMMMAMMLPSLVPMLWRYRRAVARSGETQLARLTTLEGLGYFFVWTLCGVAVFALGVTLAQIEMQQATLARAVPVVAGAIVVLAGAIQFSTWKAYNLSSCRQAPGCRLTLPGHSGAAWRQGLRFGLDCANSCANLTVLLLIVGVMDIRAMVVVTAAITLERLAPNGERVARGIGVVIVGAGLILITRALGIA